MQGDRRFRSERRAGYASDADGDGDARSGGAVRGEALNEIRPGGFSIEQRYRYDPRTGMTTVVTPADVQRGVDLRGTLVPDVVIHDGHAGHVMKVYDFKFPCTNSIDFVPWRSYPKGHPFEGWTQGQVYERAFGIARRVQPRIGVEGSGWSGP